MYRGCAVSVCGGKKKSPILAPNLRTKIPSFFEWLNQSALQAIVAPDDESGRAQLSYQGP